MVPNLESLFLFLQTKWLQNFAVNVQEVLNQKQQSQESQLSTEMEVNMLQFLPLCHFYLCGPSSLPSGHVRAFL